MNLARLHRSGAERLKSLSGLGYPYLYHIMRYGMDMDILRQALKFSFFVLLGEEFRFLGAVW